MFRITGVELASVMNSKDAWVRIAERVASAIESADHLLREI
jgi:hypothetical protein